MKHLFSLALITFCLSASAAPLAEPLCEWQYQSQSNLYTAPIVSETAPPPGLETIICDSEARVVRCLDATGKELWRYTGPWTKRLISTPALSALQPDNLRKVLITNADGFLLCLDAANGKELWREECGEVEWGGALWCDLDGDKTEEAVIGTLNGGVIAYDAAGNERWRYQHSAGREPLHIRGTMSANDVDGDGKTELFGATRYGVFALSPGGALLWETITWDDFDSPVRTAMTSDGRALLFTTSMQDNAAWGFDAKTGRILWKNPLMAAPSQALAITHDSVFVSDKTGFISAFDHTGATRWLFKMRSPAQATIAVGDVDGDGALEILAAGHDHYLYCLDDRGLLKWTYQTDLRLMSPPTLADVDQDGLTEMLLCGCDRTLRSLTLNAQYSPDQMPWPARNGNVAQTAALSGPAAVPMTTVKRNLLPNGGFDNGKYSEGLQVPAKDSRIYEVRHSLPQGWYALPNTNSDITAGWKRLSENDGGRAALKVEQGMTIVSDPLLIPNGTKTLVATIYSSANASAEARLRLIESTGTQTEISLAEKMPDADRKLHSVSVAPGNAIRCQLVLITGNNPAEWTCASVEAEISTPAKTDVLVNQVGYEVRAPKTFIVQSDYEADSGVFVILKSGQLAHEGKLESKGRIKGCYGNDWGHFYWRGDFTAFNEPGDYTVSVTLNREGAPSAKADSYSFSIGNDVIWNTTAELAYRFFYYQRCGCEIPGYHKACHLDDAKGPDGAQYELWGGWHDAGDYNTYTNAPYVHGLLRAYTQYPESFNAIDNDKNGRADILDEIQWGAEHERRMIAPDGSAYGAITTGYGFWCAPELETDNKPGTGDERPVTGQLTGNSPGNHHASMAKMALYTQSTADWIEPAERSLKWALDHGIRGVEQFATALDLHKATGKEEYATLSRDLFPSIGADPLLAESVRIYDERFGENHSAEIKEAFRQRAEALLLNARNPFGVYTFGSPDNPNFFNTPKDQGGWHIGTNMYILEAAEVMAIAYEYERDPRYQTFIYDQFNWLLGCNPFNISMMEGVGDAFMPTYHHRYTFGGVKRGAVPGGIPNGITWRAVGDDRPFADMSGADIPAFEPNEFWLPHNTNYLKALAHLQRTKKVTP